MVAALRLEALMPLTSMTGFAETAGRHAALRWRWEAKSVNGRGLDLRLRVPAGFEGLEPVARMLASERFKRGSLQAVLTVEQVEGMRGFRVDPAALADAVRIAKEIAADTGLPPARIDGLLALKGVVVQEEQAALGEEARLVRDAVMLESLASALDALVHARVTEGAKLESLLLEQIGEIEKLTEQARVLAAKQPQQLKERMMTQLSALLASGSYLSEDRLAQEVALLAAKADLREELDRLAAHCQAARAMLAKSEAVGRKLDFLAQEFNREANTLCAKASDIALTRLGLALKAVIDQFREQVQNVE
jgi:uncharacterized protein (TIGR00255 family)